MCVCLQCGHGSVICMKKPISYFIKLVSFISSFAAITACIAFICERIEEIRNKRVELIHKPYGIYEHYIKRSLDCFLSTGALIVFSPILLVLTIVGTIEMKGNPFFTQDRPGRIDPKTGKEKIFKLIKFRTMTNEKDEDGNLLPDEDRLNSYGEWVRAHSYDELPSLINLIKGDLAVVGPRPLLVRYIPRYTEEQRHRHDVRPGLTGLAQANGRNSLSWEEKFAYDVEYTDHITFLGDVKIILDTVKAVFRKEGINSETSATMEEFMGNE